MPSIPTKMMTTTMIYCRDWEAVLDPSTLELAAEFTEVYSDLPLPASARLGST